jgi:hypothetical protein
MSRFVPDAELLIDACIRYLERELHPTLAGYHRFQTRIAINVLTIVARELRQRDKTRSDERERLVALLGHDGDAASLDRELADAIAEGRLSLEYNALVSHLRQSLRDALAINSPGCRK